MDTKLRTIVKTFSFRVVATITTMAVVFVFTENLILVGMIGILELVSKLLIYYLHERTWENISWGRKK